MNRMTSNAPAFWRLPTDCKMVPLEWIEEAPVTFVVREGNRRWMAESHWSGKRPILPVLNPHAVLPSGPSPLGRTANDDR